MTISVKFHSVFKSLCVCMCDIVVVAIVVVVHTCYCIYIERSEDNFR